MSSDILKFENKHESKIFRIKPIWLENRFQLTIIEGSNAWFANVPEKQISILANERKQNFMEYYKNIKECFRTSKSDLTFDVQENELRFVIKQVIRSSVIIFFATDLEKLDFQNCVNDLLDEVTAKNVELTKSLLKLNEEKNDAVLGREIYEKKLQEFVDIKTNWEKQMYSSFILVLNEKKKRIRHLTELLHSKNNTQFTTNVYEAQIKANQQPKQSGPEPSKSNNRTEVISDSESNPEIEDYETDDETKSKEDETSDALPDITEFEDEPMTSSTALLPKRTKSNFSKVGPSTSKIYEEKKPSEPEEPAVENTPVLDFSTQDLLDRM